MKRLVLCALIGAVLMGISALSLRYMRTSCDQLTGQLEEVVRQVEAGHREQALARYQELATLWEEKEPLLELMIRHQHLDEADVGIRALPSYIEYDAPALFFAEADKIRFCLRDIWEKEALSLENLL